MTKVLHSLYGRLFGIDKSGYATSLKGIKVPAIYVGDSDSEVAISGSTSVQAATSATTGTVLNFGGTITLSTASATWSLAAPAPGRVVVIQRLSTTTGTTGLVTLASGTILTSTQAAATTVTFTGAAGIKLYGLSTSVCAAVPYTTANNAVVS